MPLFGNSRCESCGKLTTNYDTCDFCLSELMKERELIESKSVDTGNRNTIRDMARDIFVNLGVPLPYAVDMAKGFHDDIEKELDRVLSK